MFPRRLYKTLAFLLFILVFSGTAWGQSTKYIKEAMNTPFSEFDFYLFKVMLNESISNRSKIIFNGLHYDYSQNLLYLTYFLDHEHKAMQEFRLIADESRKDYLIKLADNIADKLGAKRGAVQGSLRMGGASLLDTDLTKDGFDRPAFYNEIADRTVVILRCNFLTYLYEIKRDQNGKHEYQVTEREK